MKKFDEVVNNIFMAMIYVAIIGTLILMGMGAVELVTECL